MNKKIIVTIILTMLICISLMVLLSQSSKLNEQLMIEIGDLHTKVNLSQSQYDDYVKEVDAIISNINNSLQLKDTKYDLLTIEHEQLMKVFNDQRIISETTIYKLSEMGISDYSLIEEDLFLHPELISFEAVLGGTMFFYKSHLLNDKLLYGEFEDGHINGYGIYRFDIEDGKIKWEVLSDFLYE